MADGFFFSDSQRQSNLRGAAMALRFLLVGCGAGSGEQGVCVCGVWYRGVVCGVCVLWGL